MTSVIPFLPKTQQDALLAGPAMAPPDGEVSNFINPPNENGLAHAVFAVCISVTVICLSLRVYLAILQRRVKFSEFLILGAFGNYIGWAVCMYEIMGLTGYYVHQWNVKLGTLIPLGYYISIAGVFYSVALALLKIAILLEWSVILVPQGARNYLWYACYALIALQVALMIGAVVSLNLVCIPYHAIWDFTVAGTCFDKHPIEVTSASIHLFTDVIMLALPHKVIWGLQLSIRKKVGVSFVFGLGILAVVSAIFRLQVTIAYATAADLTYTLGPVAFWAFAEMTCGFVVSCMPSMPRMLKETGLLDKFKRAFGMHVTAATGTHKTGGSAMVHSRSKQPSSIDKYSKIDDDGMPLDDFGSGRDGSTEHLAQEKADGARAIMHTTTTEVTYANDENNARKIRDEELGHRITPWENKPREKRRSLYGGSR